MEAQITKQIVKNCSSGRICAFCAIFGLFLSSCAGNSTHPSDLSNYRQTATDGPGSEAFLSQSEAEVPRNLPKSRIGNPKQYEVFGKQYQVMDTAEGYTERGVASLYGTKFHGRNTSSGEVYNMYNMTAAHKSLPIPTFVTVTNLENNQQIVVKVNDRGPFHGGRIIDLSYAAAARLGVLANGTAEVEVTAISKHVPAQLQAQVPAAPTAEPPPAASESADNAAPHVIQVGAFSVASNAEKMRQRVDRAMQVGAAYIVPEHDNSLFRVRFGVAASTQLHQVFAQLEQFGIQNYSVISD